MHLIQAHGYPKEFFFAVTNKGVGGLLKRWGEGASMIRGEWKPREKAEVDSDSDELEGDDKYKDEDEDEDEGEVRRPTDDQAPSTTRLKQTFRLADGPLVEESDEDGHGSREDGEEEEEDTAMAVDALADTFSHTLSLVPSSVRFGRGGTQRGGFSRSSTVAVVEREDERGRGRGRGRAGKRVRTKRKSGQKNVVAEKEDVVRPGPPRPPRGLGRGVGYPYSGRGRIHVGSRY